MNAFVTGGSRGIGKSIVLRLVGEGLGCAFTYVSNEEAALETVEEARRLVPGCRIAAYRLNQADSSAVEAVCEKAQEEIGDIDVLVNNAAVNRNNAAVLMSDEEWNEVIDVNLSGPFYLIRCLLMPMLSRRFGRIVNISSLAQGGSSGQAGYAASKAGLVALSNTIAREYGSKGITSNTVTVGFVPSGMTDAHMSEALKSIWLQYCPAKRTGTADEIADAVHYLITEKAGFINGEVLHVTGGLTYAP